VASYFRITLAREGEEERELGTAPTEELVSAWFSGAFAQGLLPDPARYTDEIRVYEVENFVDEKSYSFVHEKTTDTLKYVWRVSWQCFEAKPEPRIHLV
jgi:hypothetical protein